MICNRRSKVKRQLTVSAALPDASLSFYFSTKSILSKMLSTRIQCALALLFLALAVSSVSAAPTDAKLRQLLQRSLLNPAGKQELARYTLADLLSDLVQAENEVLEPEDLSRAVEKDDVRLELERAAGPMLAPRERKAGCKNFFWKTFTSC
ncbi:somatostatin 1, tandem duplicate 1 [Ctenopharyngodon idella]|uniref:somatostatin 1, tandem duplicate 1 n=1 Tax=Ctenopharyngodon idella TaxID=7959 RepID=UPI0022323F7F|nr:somatostatin 1, tandem duplicate 1 [Ctenopharyngodon idella]